MSQGLNGLRMQISRIMQYGRHSRELDSRQFAGERFQDKASIWNTIIKTCDRHGKNISLYLK